MARLRAVSLGSIGVIAGIVSAATPACRASEPVRAAPPAIASAVPAAGASTAGATRRVGDAAWLRTAGPKIVHADGAPWHGRGANLFDTRQCNRCAYGAPNVGEVKRRLDQLAGGWRASFVRLLLESYATADGRVHWRSALDDAAYLQDIREVVDRAAAMGVYVLLSVWHDPTVNAMGWPTTATQALWRRLAGAFRDQPFVLFGVVNEPQQNFDGERDAEVWKAMNDAVAAIREAEGKGARPHIVAVQGTGGWARRLEYYVTHPIAAGGGVNVAYETHAYDHASSFEARFIAPSREIPVIIGEFGPTEDGAMSLDDCVALMDAAERLEVPYLAWSFHEQCPPNLLEDRGDGCAGTMPFVPTAWGSVVKARFAKAW